MTEKDPVERTVELLVYAPVGAGLYILEAAPSWLHTFVARGRAEFDRHQETVQQRITTVRSTGQVALAFGLPKLRNRLQQRVDDLVRSPEPAARPAAPPEPQPEQGAPVAPVVQAPWVSAVDAPARDDLPIPGYDTLSATQVVERLTGLGPSELDAVHAYETAHRQRRTILGKIEQLAG